MRKLPAAIIVSMVGHVAAFAWILRDGDVLAVPLRVEPAVVAARPADAAPAEPLTVVLLDERSEPAPVSREVAPTPPQHAAISTGRPSAPEQPRPAPAISTGAVHAPELPGDAPTSSTGAASDPGLPSGGPARSPYMRLREPELPDVAGLSPEFVTDLLLHSKPVPPPSDIPGERVGHEIAELRKQLRHAERYSPDELAGLRQRLGALDDERAAEELKPAGGDTYRADKETFTAKVDADGTAHLKDKPEKLDSQDKLMLSMGIDPYGRAKLAFLDRTRDQRAAVGARHTHEQLARSAELMLNNINRLWSMTADVAARKRGLFELWYDCAETGSDDLVAGGAAARLFVVGVIWGRLRGDNAHTLAELAELNASRHSKAVFAPYE